MRRRLVRLGVAALSVAGGCEPFADGASPEDRVVDAGAADAGGGGLPEASTADAGGAPELPRCTSGAVVEEGFESGVLPPVGWDFPGTSGSDLTASSVAPLHGAYSLRILLAAASRPTSFGSAIRRRLQGACVDVELSFGALRTSTPDGLTFFTIEFPNLDQVIGYTTLADGPRTWKIGEQNAVAGEFSSLFEGALPDDDGPVRLRVRISGGTPEAPQRQVAVYVGGVLLGSTPSVHALAGDAKVQVGAIYAATSVTGEVRVDDVRIR